MKKIFIIASIILVFLGSYTAVQALTMSELEEKRNDLKNKVEEAGKSLEQMDLDITKSLETISNLDKEIYEYEEKIKAINENLNDIESRMKQTEETLAELQEEYNYQRGLLEKRLVYAYKAGPTRYLDILLKSKSITDFISNYYLIGEIIDYDNNLLQIIEKEKDEIEQIDKSLEISRDNLKIIRNEQKKIVVGLENAKVERSSYVNNLTEKEKQTQEELELYQQELDLVEAEVELKAKEAATAQYVGGEFAWPAPGYYTITSPYGMRLHPVLKTYRLHTGMDIGAPTGSTAIAANDGIVTQSTYSNSYGNMVMIDHGGGIVTLYAHGSELIAKVGDVVSRGDAIMKVGSTGWSTGPHLHFEIRINGATTDPYPYVTGKTIQEENEALSQE